MAILIPSKNIYKTNNPKIRDNVIDNLSIGQTIIRPKDEYEVAVYSDVVPSDYETITNNDLQVKDSKYLYYPSNSNYGFRVRAVCGYNLERKIQKSFVVLIPKVEDNAFAFNINSNNIEIGLRIKQAYSTTGTINYKTPNNEVSSPRIALSEEEILYELIPYSFQQENLFIDRFPHPHDMEMQSKVSLEILDGTVNLQNYISSNWIGDSVDIDLQPSFTTVTKPLANIETVTIDKKEYYKVSIANFLVSINAEFYDGIIADADDFAYEGNYEINLTKIRQEIQEVTIRINGDKKGISIEEKTDKILSGSKPFSLNGNELLQDSGTVGETSIVAHLAKNVYNQYQNGKETAIILCDIGDYYDIDSQKTIEFEAYLKKDDRFEFFDDYILFTDNSVKKIISVNSIYGYPDEDTTLLSKYNYEIINNNQIKITSEYYGAMLYSVLMNYEVICNPVLAITPKSEKMAFKNGDIVQPMVFSFNGADVPMSKTADGKAKLFEIVGNTIYYDGAIWQELSLQEYIN